MQFFLTTSPGLEPILADEARALGARVIIERPGGVTVEAEAEALVTLNLRLATALRVLVPVAEGPARSAKELYRLAAAVPWEDSLDPEGSLAVFCVGRGGPALRHTGFAALKVKDAIVDRFRERCDARPSIDRERPDLCVRVYLEGERAALSLDSSRESLHRRGYRLKRSAASLRETLAAGIVRATAWDRQSPFIDLTCGAGTLVIEAALLAAGLAPGAGREFGYWSWRPRPGCPWSREDAERALAALPAPGPSPPLLGFDRDPAMVEAARENAERAGVGERVSFAVRDLRETPELPDPGEGGVLVCNPPYGERLDDADLAGLYGAIGDVFKRRGAGYRGYIFTANLAMAKRVGLRTRSRRPLWNGPLEGRLLEYELYRGSRKRRGEDGAAQAPGAGGADGV